MEASLVVYLPLESRCSKQLRFIRGVLGMQDAKRGGPCLRLVYQYSVHGSVGGHPVTDSQLFGIALGIHEPVPSASGLHLTAL